jgi:hypothetical protein
LHWRRDRNWRRPRCGGRFRCRRTLDGGRRFRFRRTLRGRRRFRFRRTLRGWRRFRFPRTLRAGRRLRCVKRFVRVVVRVVVEVETKRSRRFIGRCVVLPAGFRPPLICADTQFAAQVIHVRIPIARYVSNAGLQETDNCLNRLVSNAGRDSITIGFRYFWMELIQSTPLAYAVLWNGITSINVQYRQRRHLM